MDLEKLLQKYCNLNKEYSQKEYDEAYERLVSFVCDLGTITDQFNSNRVVTDLDKIEYEVN